MSTRTEGLTEEITLWLDRYSPRRALQSNEQAMAAEINALMRVVLKMAPITDYTRWLERVTTQLDFQMKTSAWPTVSEVGAACSNINKSVALGSQRKGVMKSPPEIMAARMNAGEDVGDGWIYGRGAVEVMRTGQVSQETMRKYRSALYFAFKDFYGEDIAKAREADWIARHEAAESLEAASDMPKGEPFRRMPQSPDDQYGEVYQAGGAA